MKPSAPRTFSSVGKVSRKTLLVTASVAAISALAFAVVARTKMEEGPGLAVDAARQVLAATEAWQGDHGDGCPTIGELIEDGRLEEGARVEDSWGNRFRIVCDGAKTAVHSAGPDHRPGTPDDLRIGRDDG